MGDDAELYIESGGDPTTLIKDYCWNDDYYGDSYQNTVKKKNTMIFIDAESISANHCSKIIGQGKSLGEQCERKQRSAKSGALEQAVKNGNF